jgi:hypothetical protein
MPVTAKKINYCGVIKNIFVRDLINLKLKIEKKIEKSINIY